MERGSPWLSLLSSSSPEFQFSAEQRHLRSAVREFCAENFDERAVRRLMESDRRVDPAVWSRLGSELGVLGLAVPVDAGGRRWQPGRPSGRGGEFGARLACGPAARDGLPVDVRP